MQKPVTAASVMAATQDAKHHAELPASWPGGARGSPPLLGGPRDWAAACPSALETPAQCPPPTGRPARTLPIQAHTAEVAAPWPPAAPLSAAPPPTVEAVQLQAVQVLAAPPLPAAPPTGFSRAGTQPVPCSWQTPHR